MYTVQSSYMFVLCAILLLAAMSLQGCTESGEGKALRTGQPIKDSFAPGDTRPLPGNTLIVCPAYKYETPGGKAYVEGSYVGTIPKITCPTYSFYNGPIVECGWVNQVCLSTRGQYVNTGPCWNQYSFTLRGQSLHKWPEGVAPQIVYTPPQNTTGTIFIKTDTLAVTTNTNSNRGTSKSSSLPIIISQHRLTCGDENYVDLHFEAAVAHNSTKLDDKEQPWSIRYGGVATSGGQNIDLVVKLSGHTPPDDSPVEADLSTTGRINIKRGSTATLQFCFVESKTHMPVALNKVFFTIFDIDDGINGEDSSEITVSGMSEFFISNKTRLKIEKLHDGKCKFSGDDALGFIPKPSVEQMWLNSMNRTAALVFRNTSEFKLQVTSFGLPCHTSGKGEECYKNVMWAKKVGIYAHPDWYEDIADNPSFREIQAFLHKGGKGDCPMPCGMPNQSLDTEGWSGLEFAGWSEIAQIGRRMVCEGDSETQTRQGLETENSTIQANHTELDIVQPSSTTG